MKKVVRLTEEDLVRIVKKVIAEQAVVGIGAPTNEQSKPKQDWHWVGTLRDSLKPYGIVPERDRGDGNTTLAKGNDYDGIFILVKSRTGEVLWSVVVGGQSKVDKNFKINQQDYNNIGVQGEKVKNMIMKDIRPYLNMKIRPVPYTG